MSPERFLEQFGHLAEAPNGIDKLRELILQLAVRGRLVPQDPEDEPASVLLERIRAEKEQLAAEGKIKKTKAMLPIDQAEEPFGLPMGWEWTRGGNVFTYVTSGSRGWARYYADQGAIFLRIGNLDYATIELDLERIQHVEPPVGAEGTRTKVEPDDILVSITGDTGMIGIVPAGIGDAYINQHIALARPGKASCPSYLAIYLTSPVALSQLHDAQRGIKNSLGLDDIRNVLIPFAPLDEQRRIIAKVDQLMALCDELEAKQNQCAQTHSRLIRTAHHPLTQPRDHAEFRTAWQRIRENFDGLHTTVDSVKAMRQTILQIAVQGKLVPQDPSDEPASVLLEKIREEKERLVTEGKIKKTKPLSPIEPEEMPFRVPQGWAWGRFSRFVTEVATGPFGSMVHKSDYVAGGVPLINPSHLIDGAIIADPNVSVCSSVADRLASYALEEGDIVMARRGEMGRCAVVDQHSAGWLCGTGSFVLRFHNDVNRQFVILLFLTPGVKLYLGGKSVGSTMTNLNHGILNRMPVAFPPVSEQSRIVAKVDQLMALCDELESKIEVNQTTAEHFAEAVVAELAA